MRTEKISYEKATAFLQRVVGLPICDIAYRPNGSVKLRIGKRFKIETIDIDDQADCEQYIKKEILVSDFEIRISKYAQIWEAEAGQQIFPNMVIDILLRQAIEKIYISQERALMLHAGGKVLMIPACPTGKESWRIFQPETEADVLLMKEETFRHFICSKRWSAIHPMYRDLWHPFPLTDGAVWNKNQPLANSAINNLAGRKIVHMFKSQDMNLFNIGFCDSEVNSHEELTELHITCSLCLMVEKKEIQFWGDSNKEEFEREAVQFLGQTVKNTCLLDNNVLRIDCSIGSIDIIPADDDRESWRLILPSGLHVTAANSWLGI